MQIQVDRSTDFYKRIDNFARASKVESLTIFPSEVKEVLITIAIPTYNRPEQLKESIESALSLKGGYPFEVIVVDNNPVRMDGTEQMMSGYKGDGRVSYYKNSDNLGMGGNWNRAVWLSRSRWVVLLHDDDRLEPDFLEKTVPFLKKLDPAVLNTRKYSDEGQRPNRRWKNIKRIAKLDLLYGNAVDVPSGIILNREAVMAEGGFNNDYYPSLDYCFYSLLLRKYPVYMLNEDLTFYRREVNASLSLQVQEDWLIIGYYLTWQMLEHYGFPQWIILPFLQVRTQAAYQTIESAWHSGLVIPKDSLWGDKVYSSFRKGLSKCIVSLFIRLEKMKARISCFFHLINNKV